MHASVFKPKKKKPPSKFFTKSTSQNYWKIEIPVVNNWPKPFYFDQRTKLWSIYVWIHQEPWQYPINTPCKIKKGERKKGVIWGNTPWKDHGVKVQELNIKGLTSFERKR